MRGKIIKPWDCPPSNYFNQRVIRISEMDKGYSVEGIMPFFSGYNIKFCHTFGKNALVEFDSRNTAQKFLQDVSPTKFGLYAKIQFLPIPTIESSGAAAASPHVSRVICLQILRLQISLGIYDIYDECSNFGTVEKIICFEKQGKFALVQMHSKKEAALTLANLSNSSRYLPNFQFKIQYSRNQDIIIQFNNAKSFDFTHPGALAQFDQLRHTTSSESAFFTPEHSDNILDIFDLWRPVLTEHPSTQTIKVMGFDDPKTICDSLYNLFSQYGTVIKVKTSTKQPKIAIVQMASQFYARLVTTHMQNCPYGSGSGKLVLSYPHFTDPLSDSDYGQITKDYSDMADDLDITEYSKMWPPSDTVFIDGASVSTIKLRPKAAPLPERNAVKFQNINEAVMFIAKKPDVNNDVIYRFTNP
jgi:hypothetical protein